MVLFFFHYWYVVITEKGRSKNEPLIYHILSLRQILFVPCICVLYCHLLYWSSSTFVNPLCSLPVYTFRLQSDWLSAWTVMPNLKCLLGLLTATYLLLLLEKCLSVAKRQCFSLFQRNTTVLTFLQIYVMKKN